MLRQAMPFIAVLAAVAIPARADDIYRWTNPETGEKLTTLTPPPYPIKESRINGCLPNGNMVDITLDADTPTVKAALAKQKIKKAEDQRIKEERAKARADEEARQKQLAEEKAREAEQSRKEEAALRAAVCRGNGEFGIRIGMDQQQFKLCYPTLPNKINTTISATGTHEQWVYGSIQSGMMFYYFDNGILTAIQH